MASFFFQPRQLGGELADLSIELVDLLGVCGIYAGLVAFGLVGEDAWQSGQRLVTPLGQQIAMDTVFDSDLVEGLFFLEHLADELGLEGRCVLFTHSDDAL